MIKVRTTAALAEQAKLSAMSAKLRSRHRLENVMRAAVWAAHAAMEAAGENDDE